MLALIIMRSGRNRQTCCHVCGSSQLSAEYRSDEVVYLSCRHCSSMWPIETAASGKQSHKLNACLISDALDAAGATTRRKDTHRKAASTTWIAAASSRRPRVGR